MSKLMRVCNDCGGKLGERDSGEAEGGVTNGLCGRCSKKSIVKVIRRSQVREGVPDCFDKSFGNCQQTWCAFHPYCITDNPGESEMKEFSYRVTLRRILVFGYPPPPDFQKQYYAPASLGFSS